MKLVHVTCFRPCSQEDTRCCRGETRSVTKITWVSSLLLCINGLELPLACFIILCLARGSSDLSSSWLILYESWLKPRRDCVLCAETECQQTPQNKWRMNGGFMLLWAKVCHLLHHMPIDKFDMGPLYLTGWRGLEVHTYTPPYLTGWKGLEVALGFGVRD